MDIIPAKLAFVYPVVFVPKGVRRARTEYCLGRDYVGIRSIKAAEADRAFRIHYPETKSPKTGWNRKATSAEILSYDGVLWWPLMTNPPRFIETRMTAAECLTAIATGKLLGLPRDGGPAVEVKSQEPESGVIKHHGLESALPAAQRMIYENILICGRRAYCRGGEPVYVIVPHRRSKSRRVSVVNAGADRSVDPSKWGLMDPPGNGAAYSTQKAFRDGWVYRADDFDLAKAAAGNGRSSPRIDILQPKIVSASPSEIQLDALFRFAIKRLARQAVAAADDPQKRHWSILQEVGGAYDREGDAMTSLQRISALRDFAASLETAPRYRLPELKEFESSLQRFILVYGSSNGVQPDCELAPEDDAALRRI